MRLTVRSGATIVRTVDTRGPAVVTVTVGRWWQFWRSRLKVDVMQS